MTCIKIPNGIICMGNPTQDLRIYGSSVYMDWHEYCGPTFFRDKNCNSVIHTPGKKTWAAFDKWFACHNTPRKRKEAGI